MIRTIEVALSIPDNEARTALRVLQRLGVPLHALERADVYRCDVADAAAEALVATLRAAETVFNPNKHVMRVREAGEPAPGEVWIDELAPPREAPRGEVRIAGRTVAGLASLERFTAWRLLAAPGVAAEPEVVARATETLLCNRAFQRATTV